LAARKIGTLITVVSVGFDVRTQLIGTAL